MPCASSGGRLQARGAAAVAWPVERLIVRATPSSVASTGPAISPSGAVTVRRMILRRSFG
ncbi:hypothetical protein [Parabacteroides sp.]